MIREDLEPLASAWHEHGRCVEPPDRVSSAVCRVVAAPARDGGRVNVDVLELQGTAAREHNIGVGAGSLWGLLRRCGVGVGARFGVGGHASAGVLAGENIGGRGGDGGVVGGRRAAPVRVGLGWPRGGGLTAVLPASVVSWAC